MARIWSPWRFAVKTGDSYGVLSWFIRNFAIIYYVISIWRCVINCNYIIWYYMYIQYTLTRIDIFGQTQSRWWLSHFGPKTCGSIVPKLMRWNMTNKLKPTTRPSSILFNYFIVGHHPNAPTNCWLQTPCTSWPVLPCFYFHNSWGSYLQHDGVQQISAHPSVSRQKKREFSKSWDRPTHMLPNIPKQWLNLPISTGDKQEKRFSSSNAAWSGQECWTPSQRPIS
jgi:hypothetical protein